TFNSDANEKAARNPTLDRAAYSSTKAFDLPFKVGLFVAYFLKLELTDAAGKLVSDNFYWLSTKVDTLDWAKRNDTDYTPQKDFADLTGLNGLGNAKVAITKAVHASGPNRWITVSVENKGEDVAFMVHRRLTRGKGGEDVVPGFWRDNYFSLLT